MSKKVYGYTSSGEPINEELIEQFVAEAEQGYEVDQFKERRRGRGRPPLGDAAKIVGSLRLDPALRQEAELRASQEGVSVSELLRRSLRVYLKTTSGNYDLLQHFDEFHIRENLDGTLVTERLKALDRWLTSEIDHGLLAVMNEYSQLLNQFSGALRDLSVDFKRLKEFDMGTQREKIEKVVEKIQNNSMTQISRMKAFVGDTEKILSHLDEMFHSKTGKGR
jgi:predicted HicB family RNase H-like nuclease